jgi:hypothetical protein
MPGGGLGRATKAGPVSGTHRPAPDHLQKWSLKMAGQTVTDEDARLLIKTMLRAMETMIDVARSYMDNDRSPEGVNNCFPTLYGLASDLKQMEWPNPKRRQLEAAQRDKALQKLIKKASRKTPI